MYFDKFLQANVVDRRENSNKGGWSFIVNIHYNRHFYCTSEIKAMIVPEGKTKFIVDTLDDAVELQIGEMGRPEQELKLQTELFK